MADGINVREAFEWNEFFEKNELDVFDVLQGAISVAAWYWPDEFLKRRDDIAQFLFAKKSSKRSVKYNGSPGDVNSLNDEPHRLRGRASDESDHISEAGICPASMPFEETPIAKKDISRSRSRGLEEAATKTPQPHIKTKKSPNYADKDRKTSLLPKKSVTGDSGTCTASSVPCEEKRRGRKYVCSSDDSEETIKETPLQQHKRGTTPMIGRQRIKEKQNDEGARLEVSKSKDVQVSEAKAQFCRNTTSSSEELKASETPEEDVSTSMDKKEEANTTVKSSANAAEKDNPRRAEIKQRVQDRAAFERKIETSKRKLQDGYKNANASKKRIVMIDASDAPGQNTGRVPENHTRTDKGSIPWSLKSM